MPVSCVSVWAPVHCTLYTQVAISSANPSSKKNWELENQKTTWKKQLTGRSKRKGTTFPWKTWDAFGVKAGVELGSTEKTSANQRAPSWAEKWQVETLEFSEKPTDFCLSMTYFVETLYVFVFVLLCSKVFTSNVGCCFKSISQHVLPHWSLRKKQHHSHLLLCLNLLLGLDDVPHEPGDALGSAFLFVLLPTKAVKFTLKLTLFDDLWLIQKWNKWTCVFLIYHILSLVMSAGSLEGIPKFHKLPVGLLRSGKKCDPFTCWPILVLMLLMAGICNYIYSTVYMIHE